MITYINTRTAIIVESLAALIITSATIAIGYVIARRGILGVNEAFIIGLFLVITVLMWIGVYRTWSEARLATGNSSDAIGGTGQQRSRPAPQIERYGTAEAVLHIRYAGIFIEADRLGQVERGIETLSISRPDIHSAEFVFGVASTNPIAQFIVGLVVVVISLAPIALIPMWAASHGGRFPSVAIAWFAFALPGVWIIREAVRRRLHLRVTTSSSTKILVLDTGADEKHIDQFMRNAREDLGWSLTFNRHSP